MLYIGNRPSLKSNGKPEKRIEVNIFDFNDEIYNQNIRLELVSFIREDEKFDNMKKLSAKLGEDKKATEAIFDLESVNVAKKETANCTVAILNYNGLHYLESYLPTVLYSSRHHTNYTVIDNGSTDDSIDYLEEWHPEVEITKLTKNYGFADGYNKGLKSINTKYTVILNSDVVVAENWLDPILYNFRNNLNTLIKNETTSSILWKFPMRLILDGVAGIKFLLGGNADSTISIIKAHFAVYGSMGHTLRKKTMYNRLINENRINHESSAGRYSGSILIAYYLQGKKFFSEIIKP